MKLWAQIVYKEKKYECFLGEIPNKVALTFCSKSFVRCPKLFDADKSFRGKRFSLLFNLEMLQTIKILNAAVTSLSEVFMSVTKHYQRTNGPRTH